MKFLLIIIFVIFSTSSFAETKTGCEGILAKLKAECNIVGKSMNKMKKFSKENQTLEQVGDNIGKGVDKIKKKF
tara:strand:- start:212 stop:433 length:222 start_codon:yes stop_codon:yes gene_type:complete